MIPDRQETVYTMNAAFIEYTASNRTLVPGRPFSALTFRLKGRISVTANGKTLISEPGQITYIPKGLSYATTVLEGGEMIAVHYTSSHNETAPSVVTPHDGARFGALFSLLRRQAAAHQQLEARAAFYSILALLRREQTAYLPPRMQDAQEEIRKRLDDPDLTVVELAARAGVSEAFFRREFSRCFALSPNRYIRACRLEQAARLLETGLCSVSDAATRCGFDSLSYFSSAFRKQFGVLPSRYARETLPAQENKTP